MPLRPTLYDKYSLPVAAREYADYTLDHLTKKQAKFVKGYLDRMAPTGGALEQLMWDCGYAGSADTVRSSASKHLRDAKVLAVLDREYNKRLPGIGVKSMLNMERIADDPKTSARDKIAANKDLTDRSRGPVAARGSVEKDKVIMEDLLDILDAQDTAAMRDGAIESDAHLDSFNDEEGQKNGADLEILDAELVDFDPDDEPRELTHLEKYKQRRAREAEAVD